MSPVPFPNFLAGNEGSLSLKSITSGECLTPKNSFSKKGGGLSSASGHNTAEVELVQQFFYGE